MAAPGGRGAPGKPGCCGAAPGMPPGRGAPGKPAEQSSECCGDHQKPSRLPTVCAADRMVHHASTQHIPHPTTASWTGLPLTCRRRSVHARHCCARRSSARKAVGCGSVACSGGGVAAGRQAGGGAQSDRATCPAPSTHSTGSSAVCTARPASQRSPAGRGGPDGGPEGGKPGC